MSISKNSTVLVVILLLLPLTFVPFYVGAHGSGVSHEEQKEGYFIDIGYSEEFPEVGKSLRFDFSAYPADKEPNNSEVFTDVWVRLNQERDLFFSGGISKPTFGSTGFTYVFPKAGTYDLTARFQKEGNTVVETTFPITVVESQDTNANNNDKLILVLTGALGLGLGFVGSLFFRRKFERNEA